MFNFLCFFTLFIFTTFSFYSPAKMIPNDEIDDSQALQALIQSTPDGGEAMIKIPGVYDICSTIAISNINQVTISAAKGVIFKKCNNFDGEYLLTLYTSSFVSIKGFSFIGLTKDTENYAWGEQGVLIAGSSDISVSHNQFFDFGDAALRVVSSRRSTDLSPINSYRVVVQHNYFHNITQVSTTYPWSADYGGTEDITFANNIFENIKGGLKLASRKPVSKALIKNNTFKNMKETAIELVYYSDVKVTGNTFVNIGKFALNVYPNKSSSVNVPFNWGDIYISDNSIINAKGGIRVKANVPDELIDDDYIKCIYIKNNHFIDVDMSVYSENKYKSLVKFLDDGQKNFIFSVVDNNLYNLLPNVSFFSPTEGVKEESNMEINQSN
ncbi:right-handed parallel beta-helix repeat-containing protein [Pseudoalteromonas sp. APC 3355]|uniref:right-handed parallel beta-helix repeat-containing protein n=1 Tax=Pseudoalteromonas sp. APC 3355 TaxID=3035199 RepID=UPI0025B5B1F1|nr:right-handed parallel beta-helix repeat-containing protein [Pseudoalteromonas sp. APC 3355]MDN3473609.1 right-handed parallel beta-helix repeat-containing protein [Pseudoalteromonas sp. APC 3355]